MERVGIGSEAVDRYPHEFSGGQRQRLAIARAIVTRPKLIVADEPVSALDVSIRGRILDLFETLRRDLDVAFLFISHDLNVVRAVTHRIAVMDAGRIVEIGPTRDVMQHPRHEVTRALIAASPDLPSAIAQRQRLATIATTIA